MKYMLRWTSKNYDGYDGFYTLESKMSAEKYKESTTSKFTPVMGEYSIDYFKRIVKLCEERDIRPIVTMPPFSDIYLEKIGYASIYEKMGGLCKENGVEYIDFNMLYDEIDLDYDDFEDAFLHAST